jgi:hypothetical protein
VVYAETILTNKAILGIAILNHFNSSAIMHILSKPNFLMTVLNMPAGQPSAKTKQKSKLISIFHYIATDCIL